jgi:hypothetical protein
MESLGAWVPSMRLFFCCLVIEHNWAGGGGHWVLMGVWVHGLEHEGFFKVL